MKPPIWLIPLVTIGLIVGAWGLGKAIGEWEISGRQQTPSSARSPRMMCVAG